MFGRLLEEVEGSWREGRIAGKEDSAGSGGAFYVKVSPASL